jgi:hypothetical protein
VLYAASGAAAIFAVLLCLLDEVLSGGILLLACLLTIIAIKPLRYVEFETVNRLLWSGRFRRSVEQEITLGTLQESLRGAQTVDDSWILIREYSRKLQVDAVSLQLSTRVFEEVFRPDVGDESYKIDLSMGPTLKLSLRTRSHEGEIVHGVALMKSMRTFLNMAALAELKKRDAEQNR